MGIVVSLLLLAVGAILRFAVTADVPNWDLQTTGVILMIIGALGVVLSFIFWSSWGGFGRRTRTLDADGDTVIRTEREIR